MFENCYSLESLDLSDFDASSIVEMKSMFKNCKNLISLYLNNLNFPNLQDYDGIFDNINTNLSIFVKGNNESKNLNEFSCYLKKGHKLIIKNNECIDNCINDKKYNYTYEYHNMCYDSCPNGTKIKSNNNLCEDILCENNYYYNYNQTECIDEIPKGYYCNDSYLHTIDICDIKCENCSLESNKYNLCISCNNDKNFYEKFNDSLNNNSFINCYNEAPEGYILENRIYKPCYYTCRTCSGYGDEKDNRCISCKDGYVFKNYNDTNCYENCTYYYFDSNNNSYCTNDYNCPYEYNKLIIQKKKCVSDCSLDDIYKYEYNNTCYEFYPNNINISSPNLTQLGESLITDECNLNDFLNNKCKIKHINKNESDINNDAKMKDKIINSIQKGITDNSMNEIINNIFNGDKNDLVIEDNNIIYQLTSTENQDNNDNINISTINLGECGNILKNKYNISQNQSLLIFKIDYFQEGSSIPIIGYEIYNPINKEKLKLEYCKNTTININIPANLNEENLYKYDPENEYYTKWN